MNPVVHTHPEGVFGKPSELVIDIPMNGSIFLIQTGRDKVLSSV
jgi:hypothetical protein